MNAYKLLSDTILEYSDHTYSYDSTRTLEKLYILVFILNYA